MNEDTQKGNWIAWEDPQGERKAKVTGVGERDHRGRAYNVALPGNHATCVSSTIARKIDPPPGEE